MCIFHLTHPRCVHVVSLPCAVVVLLCLILYLAECHEEALHFVVLCIALFIYLFVYLFIYYKSPLVFDL